MSILNVRKSSPSPQRLPGLAAWFQSIGRHGNRRRIHLQPGGAIFAAVLIAGTAPAVSCGTSPSLTTTVTSSPSPAATQSPYCYTTGDPGYPTSANTGVTICHTPTSAEEGLYYATPRQVVGSSYGQIYYNVQPIRTAPDVYQTLLHSGPAKLNDPVNCPMTPAGGGTGIGYPGFPTTAPPFPIQAGAVAPNPASEYDYCVVGDSVQGTSYTATGPGDLTPYTIGPNPPSYVITGSETIPAAATYYGATSGTSIITLAQPLVMGTYYSTITVQPLQFTLLYANLTIGSGTTTPTPNVTTLFTQLKSGGSNITTTAAISATALTSTISLSAGLPKPLDPGAPLIIGSASANTSPIATKLTAGLTSGLSTHTLSVSSLPYAIASGTVLTLLETTPGTPAPQQMTVSSTAAAGAMSISVTSFTPNYSYPSGTSVLSPSIPAGAKTIPVTPFIAGSNSQPAGTPVMTFGIPQGTTTIPTIPFEALANYPAGTQIVVQNDANGGAGNPMTVAGRHYYPYGDPYYYTFFIGENRTDADPTCPWVADAGPCGWREMLLEARTTDFIHWQVYSNLPAADGGPWVNLASISSTVYPVVVPDRNGNPIEGNYPSTAQGVQGLLGAVNQVYTSYDGAHTFRYFYSDHPAPTSSTSWQSDLQIYNLYEREASTLDPNAFDSTGNIRWSAPTLVATNVPGSGLVTVAKAHGANRWVVTWTDNEGLNPTTDYRVEYSSDMTNLPYTSWLAPLSHLMANLPPPNPSTGNTHYLDVQDGRLYGAGSVTTGSSDLPMGYLDVIAQGDYMTDPDGNLTAPDNGTPGYQRGGMVTWTDFPLAYNDNNTGYVPNAPLSTPGNTTAAYGAYGGYVYQATFDVSGNAVGDFAVNGDFGTGVFTGDPTYDGWTLFNAANGGANYPPYIVTSDLLPNGHVAVVGPSNLSAPESQGGSGMYQAITIPATANSVNLYFSYYDVCSDAGDYQSAFAYDTTTATYTWVVPPSCDGSETWKAASANLSASIGHTVVFYFVAIKTNTTATDPVAMELGCHNQCFVVDVE